MYEFNVSIYFVLVGTQNTLILGSNSLESTRKTTTATENVHLYFILQTFHC
jgi:hypothetical protein